MDVYTIRKFSEKPIVDEEQEKERLRNMSEKELMIEMIILMKKIDVKCDDIARKVVIWSD